MREDTRSLWEQYDSEVEPWRRGRVILVLIGALNLVLQGPNITAQIALANIELLLPTISAFVVFWLLLIGSGGLLVGGVRWSASLFSFAAGFMVTIFSSCLAVLILRSESTWAPRRRFIFSQNGSEKHEIGFV